MRVAVVGATGNAGTGVLRALHTTPEVTSILGIARRMPDDDVEPYRHAEWTSIDIAAASDRDDAIEKLTEAFRGADAVIHLAWLIQPNSNRELLRRVNVEGTERVAAAVAAADVGHLVVASSVGAYSPDRGTTLRDESWPTGGIRTSHYSVDKAAQERVLDEFEQRHPDTVVTRLRPALIFDGDAASEIQRYFINPWFPVQALKHGKLPALPLPKAFRGVQALHSADVGRAYAAAVVARKHGAFNVSADDVLGPQQLAEILDHGRVIRLPTRLMRNAMNAGHKSKLIAADRGWFDMGMLVPLLDNSKAKRELGWEPQVSAAEALQSLIAGMISGKGSGSVPMRPRNTDRVAEPLAAETVAEGSRAEISSRIDRDLLNLYLSDHLTGATAGAERIERMATDFVDTPVFAPLSEVAHEIRIEREFLRNLIQDLGLRRLRYRQAVSWVGERAGRLKLNGRVLSRSPMTLVLEAELMRSAVNGKIGVWQLLEEYADDLGIKRSPFTELIEQTRRQSKVFDHVHEYARERAFREDRETFTPQDS